MKADIGEIEIEFPGDSIKAIIIIINKLAEYMPSDAKTFVIQIRHRDDGDIRFGYGWKLE